MDLGTISAALSSTKTLLDLAKTAVVARDDSKFADALQSLKERVFDIQNAALQTQEKMSAMQDQIETLKDDKRQLNAEIAAFQKQFSERSRYALKEIHEGSFVLAYVSPEDGSDPAHCICQPCMDNAAKKVVLQRQKKGGRVNLVCNECESAFFTGETYQMNANVWAYR